MDVRAAQIKRPVPDEEPQQEPMRGTRRLLAHPSTDQKKKRRQQRRMQPRTAAGYFDENDWDDIAPMHDEDAEGAPMWPEYTHHRFDEPDARYARRYAGPDLGQPVQARFCTVATQLGTQVERLIPGQSTITTPTGQQLPIKNVRPHESDGSYVYVDTPFGTSLVQRGTSINDTGGKPSGQQELPNAGNPMGNSGTLPMSGRGPQGGAAQPSRNELSSKPCPNCGREGGLRMSGGEMKCSYCGHEFPLANSPGGMTFSHEDTWSGQPRTNRAEAPTAHVWGSKYQTQERPGLIARRARQVLSQMEEKIL